MALGSFPPLLLLLRSSSNSALLWPLLPSTKSAKWKKETRNYSAERSSNDEIEMRNQRWEKKREAREWNNTSLRPTMSSTLCSNIVQQRLKRSSGSRAEGLTSLFCDALSPHLFAFPLVHKPHGGKGTKNKRAHFYFMLVLKLLRNSETILRE